MGSAAIVFFVLAALITIFATEGSARKKKVLAADLVKDGQLINLKQKKYQVLFDELINKYNFSRAELDKLFRGVSIERRVLVLMDHQWEAKPYYKYWPLFITPPVVEKGKQKLIEHKKILDRVEKELGVNREIVVAIWAIESKFGIHKGRHNVFKTLNTLFNSYPRRAKFFRKQLIHFLLLCRENKFDPLSINGSYAGAFGQTQFIPSSYREYAVSFDGDNYADVFGSTSDILASIANYLRRFHYKLDKPIYVDIGNELKSPQMISTSLKGRKGRIAKDIAEKAQKVKLPASPGNKKLSIVTLELNPKNGGGYRYVAAYPNFQAITKWNHSNRYAMAVSELAEKLAGK